MIEELLVPFSYDYMVKAMWVSALVGAVCAFLSAYLMLKGWSLIGDALGHAVVPGVATAYLLGLPYSAGAFVAGGLAAASMASSVITALWCSSYRLLSPLMIRTVSSTEGAWTLMVWNRRSRAPSFSMYFRYSS